MFTSFFQRYIIQDTLKTAFSHKIYYWSSNFNCVGDRKSLGFISNSEDHLGQNLFGKYQVLNSSVNKLGVAAAMFAY